MEIKKLFMKIMIILSLKRNFKRQYYNRVEEKMEIKNSIAIIGSRGIPNRYGGFEKFTEIISAEMVKKGYKVYVSNEYSFLDKYSEYKGVNLFYFPIKPPKNPFLRVFYEFLYDGYSLLWASRRVNQVYMLGYSAAALFFIPKLFGKKLYVNPDGIEWKRNKFSAIIRFLLKLSERLAVFWADDVIVDSKEIKEYLDNKYKIKSTFIPYGVYESEKKEWNLEKLPEILKNVTINPSFYLAVARLEPENNIDIIVEGYMKSKTNSPLIVVGDYADERYKNIIFNIINNNSLKNDKIIFTGSIYDHELLNMLRQNCKAYIHGHSVGGTNPSLLEAMISKNMIIANDNVFNKEVCGDQALYFKNPDELKYNIEQIESDQFSYLEFKEKVYSRAKVKYSWDEVTDQYFLLFSRKSAEKDLELSYSLNKTGK